MAKMHFKYASMNSGKSLDLMRTAYNYEENGYRVLVAKPLVDTKDGCYVSSRVGLKRKVDILLGLNDFVFDKFKDQLLDINCIFIDEAQFLTPKQVDDLYLVSKVADIPVICYGLRDNFMMESFQGSKRLLEVCDELEEIPTLCECGSIARFVGRMIDGEYQTSGDEVVIDGSTSAKYKPLCGKCYLQKVKKFDFNKYRKDLGL